MYKKTLTLLIASFILFLIMFSHMSYAAIDPLMFESVIAHLYPIELKNGDEISDGPFGMVYKCKSDTLFIWVDLYPNCFFAHKTVYVFIRDDKIEPVLVKDGMWYPLLNGHPIMFGRINKSALISPYLLDAIKVYFYPLELKRGDVISDGPNGILKVIEYDTLYIWINLIPQAYFAHPVKHLFISADRNNPVSAEKGMWYPLLNGRPFLHYHRNLGAVVSPFNLTCPGFLIDPGLFSTSDIISPLLTP